MRNYSSLSNRWYAKRCISHSKRNGNDCIVDLLEIKIPFVFPNCKGSNTEKNYRRIVDFVALSNVWSSKMLVISIRIICYLSVYCYFKAAVVCYSDHIYITNLNKDLKYAWLQCVWLKSLLSYSNTIYVIYINMTYQEVILYTRYKYRS